MTTIKTNTQLIILLFTLALSQPLLAEESVKNEHKNNGAGNTVSDADTAGHVDGGFSSTVSTQTKATAHSQHKTSGDIDTFKQMETRRRQMHEAQLEAYKRHMQERRQQAANDHQARRYGLPEDAQTRREEYIKLMNERRTLIKKMMNESRQAAEEKRKAVLLKMHQTSTPSEQAKPS